MSSSRAAAVEDTLEEEDEAGPELPPDFNHDEDILDDEEGRFFGGGISRDTAGALDFVEKLDQGDTGVSIAKFNRFLIACSNTLWDGKLISHSVLN